jgi:hypothetical protein
VREPRPGRGQRVFRRLNLAADFFLDRGDVLREAVEGRFFVVAAGDIGGVGGDVPPDVVIELAAREFADGLARHFLKFGIGDGFAAVTDEVEVGRQQVIRREVVDRRDELAGGEVA